METVVDMIEIGILVRYGRFLRGDLFDVIDLFAQRRYISDLALKKKLSASVGGGRGALVRLRWGATRRHPV